MSSEFSAKNLDLLYALKQRIDFFNLINEYKLKYIAQRYYVELFLNYYDKAKKHVSISSKELISIKNDFNSIININFLLKNKYFNMKEKVMLLILKFKA